jgi:microcin C transport system permease protein
MLAYIFRRLLLIIPTILGIMLVSFLVIQFAPGGPVEQAIAQLTGADVSTSDRLNRGGSEIYRQNNPTGAGLDANTSRYRGAQGLDPQIIKDLEKQFGFDKPAHERFLLLRGTTRASISAAAISTTRRCSTSSSRRCRSRSRSDCG